MKFYMALALLAGTTITIDGFAEQSTLPKVCQEEAYCRDCCIAVQTKIQQETREKNSYPVETIRVDPAKQAQ
jgi:hypothetical protein